MANTTIYFRIAASYSAGIFVQFFRKRWNTQPPTMETIKPPTSKLCACQTMIPANFVDESESAEILPEDSNYMQKFIINRIITITCSAKC